MKEVLFLAVFFMLISVSSITGEVITGNVAEQSQNVSIFVIPGGPVINIFSPLNISYSYSDLVFNYSVGNVFDNIWYNLDGAENFSLNSSSGFFNFNPGIGPHILNFFANQSGNITSVSVYFDIFTPPVSGSSGGGSGGGGGGSGGGSSIVSSVKSDVLFFEDSLFEVSIFQGESQKNEITITNPKDFSQDFNVILEDMNDFVFYNSKISFLPKETKKLELTFLIEQGTFPRNYVGRIIFENQESKIFLPIILSVKQRNPLFDVNLEILSNYENAKPGEKISVNVDLTNIEFKGTPTDVELFYSIVNSENNETYKLFSETIAVESTLSINRKIEIPGNLPPGIYLVMVDLKYNHLFASSYDSIVLEEKNKYLPLIVSLVIVGVLAWSWIIFNKIRKNHKS